MLAVLHQLIGTQQLRSQLRLFAGGLWRHGAFVKARYQITQLFEDSRFACFQFISPLFAWITLKRFFDVDDVSTS